MRREGWAIVLLLPTHTEYFQNRYQGNGVFIPAFSRDPIDAYLWQSHQRAEDMRFEWDLTTAEVGAVSMDLS